MKTDACKKCPYAECAFVPSSIYPGAELVFIGEVPGSSEVDLQATFVGESGQFLRRIMTEVGLDHSKASFMNCVKCRPTMDEVAKKKARRICYEEFLSKELAEAKPKMVVLVGSTALHTFFEDKTIMDSKGNISYKDGIPFLPVLHPAYCLKNPFSTSFLRKDLAKIRPFLLGDLYKDRDFRLVDSEQMAEDAKLILHAAPMLGIDIETNNTLNCFQADARIWTIAFSYGKDKAFCFPLEHPDQLNVPLRFKCSSVVKELLASKIPKCLHNATFDIKWLRKFGYEVDTTKLYDSMVLSHVLDEHRASKGLKALAAEYLDGCTEQFSNDLKSLAAYNCEDASNTLRLTEIFLADLAGHPDMLALVESVLMPVIDSLVDLELNGIYLDQAYLKKATAEFSRKREMILEAIEIKFPEAAGVDINSPKQLSKYFFETKDLEPIKKTKTGYSVDADVLTKLRARGEGLARYILKYRECEKILNTYLLTMPEMVQSDGRIHAQFNLTGTVTGRLSCVAAWTPIETRDGVKQIKDVKVGDYVWTHKGRWRQVIETQIKGIEPMFTVHFSNGNVLTCTSSHKVLSSGLRWLTIKEISDEYFKDVDQGKHAACAGPVQTGRSSHNDAALLGVQDRARQSYLHSAARDSGSRVSGAESNSVFPVKAGVKESDARKDAREASTVERFVRRWLRVFDHTVQRKASVCAPCRDMQSTGPGRAPRSFLCSPYRRGSQEQSFGQSCACDNVRAQGYSLFTGEGQPGCSVEKIYLVGRYEVYDFTVDEDASYLACGVFSHNSSKPNMQNLPRDPAVKRMFGVPPGYALLQLDASQAELRVGCSIANEPTMIDAYRKGMDIHRLTASKVLGIPEDSVTKEDRQKAKGTNFGLLYGQKTEGFMIYAESNYGVKFSLKEATRIREEFFKTYSRLPAWYQEVAWRVRTYGRIDYPTGYVAHFPHIKGFREVPDQVMNQAINYPVQGSSSHIVFYTMSCLRRFLKRAGADFKYVSQVHDSIGMEIKLEMMDDVKLYIETICKDLIPHRFPWLKVPMVFDMAVGASWGDMIEVGSKV